MGQAVRGTRHICAPLLGKGLALPLSSFFSHHRMFPFQPYNTTGAPCRTVMSSEWKSTPRIFSSSGFTLLDPSLEIEEETLPTYFPENYYPVQQGDVLNERYQITKSLPSWGYGVTSTVWFGRDLMWVESLTWFFIPLIPLWNSDSKYVALKIYVVGQHKDHELGVYECLNSVESNHPGRRFIRKLLDHFHQWSLSALFMSL